jgi:hypothetical protein
MPLTESEEKLANWALSKGLPLEAFFQGDDAEKQKLVADLANEHYLKGKTENYIRQVNNLWADISPVLNEKAEEATVTPQLARVEALVGETNTRRELSRTREALGEIPREKLTGERIERYERIEGTLNTVENVITSLEEEIGMLGRAPAVTTDEQRNVNALLREARARNITSAGGQVIGESRVRYRSEAPARTFTIREYPIRFDEKSGVWSEQSRYRVYREDTGEYIGEFSERPTAAQIRERWRD